MTTKTMDDIASLIKGIDFCMLQTHTADSQIAARPMSTNSEVDYDGTTRFFTWTHSRMTEDIRSDPHVTLTFQGKGGLTGLFGAPGAMIAVQGTAKVIEDRAILAEHWHSSMDRWFDQGLDTPGVVMLDVSATRIDFWDGMETGTLHPA